MLQTVVAMITAREIQIALAYLDHENDAIFPRAWNEKLSSISWKNIMQHSITLVLSSTISSNCRKNMLYNILIMMRVRVYILHGRPGGLQQLLY